MGVKEAIDILANQIDDYVIGDYCCEICEVDCKDKECPFHTAIEAVLSEIEKKDKIIDEMAKHIQENEFYDDIICMEKNCKNEKCNGECEEDCIKEYFTKKVEGK